VADQPAKVVTATALGKIILLHLIPACLQPDSYTKADPLRAHELREWLAKWVEQYTDEGLVRIRSRVLGVAQAALSTQSAESALKTIRALGFLTPTLERKLESIARQDDELGDLAINCLAGLAPSQETKEQIVREVLLRLPRRQLGTFNSVMWELRDPRFVPALTRWLIDKPGDAFEPVGLLGLVADQAPHDNELQKRVWTGFEHAAR
jgi:hypothetical protein